MEENRSMLQLLLKIPFSQSSEMINPLYSKGLPANLAADAPRLSLIMTGVDVNKGSCVPS